MEKICHIKIDTAKVRMAVDARIPLIITTYKLPHEMEEYMSGMLANFLERQNHKDCVDGLSYCLKELVNNAKKANTKRVYFQEKKLNIEDPEQYKEGMVNFKQDTISEIDYYLNRQKEKNLFVKVIMKADLDKVQVEVRNNVELTVFEYKRIHDKLSRSLMYNSVEEGFAQLLDDTEGAGLGLVIMILILRRAGLSEESYEVICENGETITRVTLPFGQTDSSEMLRVADEFIDTVDLIPDFADNITELNKVVVNPSSALSEISSLLSRDPVFIADMLKTQCSLLTEEDKPIETISALMLKGGRRMVRSQLFVLSSSADNVMPENEACKKIWMHSYAVALCAYNVAQNLCSITDAEYLERIYLAALLHDLGKLVFESMHPSMQLRFDELCSQKKIESETLGILYAGKFHEETGELIAKKWNFPVSIQSVIRYHHEPQNAPEEYREMAYIIQFADLLVHYSAHDMFYEQMPAEILNRFKIEDEAQILGICHTMERSATR